MAYTNIDDPSAHFQTATYSNNGSTITVTNDGNSNLKPDLIWNKQRTNGGYHGLWDSSRGISRSLSSNVTANEQFNSGKGITAFNTDGFTGVEGSWAEFNQSSQTSVTWQWKANGGTTASNTTGSINATVQANTTAGFSIITWSGTGSVGTIGHGLGAAPAMLIVKNRTTGVDWAVYHKDMTDAGYTLALNNDDGQIDSGTNRWNHTAPTSSVFSVGAGQQTNQNTNNMICYAFAEKQGYSKFGKYIGNSLTNGAFVYTGFKPAFIMLKQSSNSGNGWFIIDSTRDPDNKTTSQYLRGDESGAEGSSKILDLLSNGFKLKNNDSGVNGAYHTYIYMAFAENPFVTSTGTPTPAG